VPDIVVLAKVEEDRQTDQEITDKGCQDRRAYQCMILVTAENFDDCCGGESAGGQGNTAGDIKSDPDTKRIGSIQVGDTAETVEP
jgi:hypothetical protein